MTPYDPWDEPVDATETRAAATIESGDYIRLSEGERLKVVASYKGAAGVPSWYLDAYKPGHATRRIGCEPGATFTVEIRE